MLDGFWPAVAELLLLGHNNGTKHSMRYPGFLSLCLVTACAALPARGAPRTIEVRPADTYTNAASQFRFPPKSGDFERQQIRQFDNGGRNVGADYHDVRQGVTVSVFVYPMEQQPPHNSLRGHFESCKADIRHLHPDAKSVADDAVEVSAGLIKRPARHAAFSFTQRGQQVRSELYLIDHRRWFMKVRATYPTGQQTVVEPAVKLFVEDFLKPR